MSIYDKNKSKHYNQTTILQNSLRPKSVIKTWFWLILKLSEMNHIKTIS